MKVPANIEEYKFVQISGERCQCPPGSPPCWVQRYGSVYTMAIFRTGRLYATTYWLSKN